MFLDANDQKMVVTRDEATEPLPLESSGIRKENRFTFYDQVHTTGIDVKQPLRCSCRGHDRQRHDITRLQSRLPENARDWRRTDHTCISHQGSVQPCKESEQHETCEKRSRRVAPEELTRKRRSSDCTVAASASLDGVERPRVRTCES